MTKPESNAPAEGNNPSQNTTAPENKENKETLKLPESPEKKMESLFDLENMTVEQKDQEAKKWGYIPAEDFKGDQKRHMTAEEYLKASERKLPALKHQVKKQDDIIDNLRKMNETLSKNLENQKTELDQQFKEASDDQDFFRMRTLEKKEKALEQDQDELKSNMTALEGRNEVEEIDYSKQQVQDAVGRWVQTNSWYNNPQTPQEHAQRSFADQRFNEYSVKYPNADPTVLMSQISNDLDKFSQSQVVNSNYGYTPGGQNVPMGQQVSNEKIEANLNEGGKRMLNSVRSIARSSEEKESLTKSFLGSSTNDTLFKWYKN